GDRRVKTLRSITEVRSVLAHLRAVSIVGPVGLVPTMGAFHDGHVALFRAARRECDVVVASLFVNPTQFGDPADLAAYPRNEARDVELATDAGVDYLFMPAVEEIYPQGYGTWVD